MPEHTADLLSCWIRRGGSKSQKAWWRIIPHCIWWTVWKERNSRNFEDRSNYIQKVRWDCIASFYFWCKEKGLEDTGDCRIIRILVSIFFFFFSSFVPLCLQVTSISLILKNTPLPFFFLKKKTDLNVELKLVIDSSALITGDEWR
ncbi:hypothetical protein MTR67_002493 [Solanum verrucosum]|uniref:Uncharacterized protein n=1 Tax=Solanum verrucosum TaxID=315347 RepID=A0AAF0PQK7_SOLVR|nr:hypothetical protein MTR67_002493 [Solanum verrucosum]